MSGNEIFTNENDGTNHQVQPKSADAKLLGELPELHVRWNGNWNVQCVDFCESYGVARPRWTIKRSPDRDFKCAQHISCVPLDKELLLVDRRFGVRFWGVSLRNTAIFSFADQLAVSRNRPAGFDYMRTTLAAAIICVHGANVTLGLDRAMEIEGHFRMVNAMLLALFFTLSGFLVTASLLRCKSLISFIGLRVVRIAPALMVDTTLSAIIIGPIFTAMPLTEYFADSKFRVYFLNIVGDIHFELPGVFLHNPAPGLVNAQLWTVPYELWCYAILALLAATTICFNRVLYLGFLVLAQIGLVFYDIYHSDELFIHMRPHLLVFCFLLGVGFYLWRDKVPFNRATCLFALVLCAVGMADGRGDAMFAAPAAYVACYLGLMNPRRSWIVSSGDYSYGMYLYGFVIQQCVAAFGPSIQYWYLNVLISLPAAFGVAIASWHLVEKHALRFRDQLERFEGAVLSRTSVVGFWRGSPQPIESGATLGGSASG